MKKCFISLSLLFIAFEFAAPAQNFKNFFDIEKSNNLIVVNLSKPLKYDAEAFAFYSFDFSADLDGKMASFIRSDENNKPFGGCLLALDEGLLYGEGFTMMYDAGGKTLFKSEDVSSNLSGGFFEPLDNNNYASCYRIESDDNTLVLKRDFEHAVYCVTDGLGRIVEYCDFPFSSETIASSNRTYKPKPEDIWYISYGTDGYIKSMHKESDIWSVDISFRFEGNVVDYSYDYVVRDEEMQNVWEDEHHKHRIIFKSYDSNSRWTSAEIYTYDVVSDDMVIWEYFTREFVPVDNDEIFSDGEDFEEDFEEEDFEEDSEEDTFEYALVDKKPTFQGGDANKFSRWVNSKLKYPEEAKDNGIQGRVDLQFTVRSDGTVGNVKVLKGVDPPLDAEAVRVVSNSPKWRPGAMDDIPVNVTYAFSVIFQLR